MSNAILLPTPKELEASIIACRDELAALKKLHRLALAAQAARDANRARRQGGGCQSGKVVSHG
jgi:hypothetical protein